MSDETARKASVYHSNVTEQLRSIEVRQDDTSFFLSELMTCNLSCLNSRVNHCREAERLQDFTLMQMWDIKVG
jgi:hypothetical protein